MLAIRCPNCGPQIVDEAVNRCPQCARPCKPYQAGAVKAPGLGAGNKPFPRHFSWMHGKTLTTWDEYHRANREAGLVDTGIPAPPRIEEVKLVDDPARRGRWVDD